MTLSHIWYILVPRLTRERKGKPMSKTDSLCQEILRRKGKMTIQELADRAGLRYATLHNLLSGKTQNPRMGTLQRIADALHCRIGDLLRHL